MILLLCLAAWQSTSGLYIYAKAELAQILISQAWHQTLEKQALNPNTRHSSTQIQPWAWADTWPVARLVFPGSEKELMVLSGASGRVLAFGPGYLQSSAYPGKSGNTVIVGHRDTHFSLLRDLQPGQFIVLETLDGSKVNYQVIETLILDESQTGILSETDTMVLTLITCYPFDAIVPGGRLRYAVIAEPAWL